MNIVTRMAALVGGRATGTGLTNAALAALLVASERTAAGKTITPETAVAYLPVYACVRVIAETVASLPLLVYRRLERGRERDPRHPLYPVLHDQPNPEMTSFEFWEAMLGNALLWGNAYAEIERAGGTIKALWPLRPDRMEAVRDRADRLSYVYILPDGQPVTFRPEQIFRWGCTGGLSPVAVARQAIGMGLAAEEFGARFFGNDSRPGGILTMDGKLSDTGAESLRRSWESMHSGSQNRWRVAVLENGVTWQAIGIPPKDAQYLELRKFQALEIARLYRVPPHLIQELDRATWGNIEHQAIDFVTHTIRPWAVRIEKAIGRDLFGATPSRRTHYAEFLVDGLLRGDAVTRATALATQRQNGVLTANEWREIENRNPMDGGDALLVNGNMLPADQVGLPPAPTPAPEPTGDADADTA